MSLAAAGCATFSEDGGFRAVETTVQERLGKDVKWARSPVEAESLRAVVANILAASLSADDAVQVALLNNRGLQAMYAELAIAEADLVQAGRLRNPHYSLSRVQRGQALPSIDEALSLEIISIMTLPLRSRMEARRFAAVQFMVSERMLKLVQETRHAYFQTLAADELVRYMDQVRESAAAAAELAQRMAEAGNFPALTRMREQAFNAEAMTNLVRARHAAVAAREKLMRLMGLTGVALRLPERLPDLPVMPAEPQDIELTALRDRLDVQAAKQESARIAASLGLSRATRFINVLELGRARKKDADQPFSYGYEISVELPLFDWGGTRVAKAEALYMQSVEHVADVVITARSEVREAYSAYRSAYESAKHYRDEIVPLRKRISDETLLRYNGMLIGVFELLADAREQIASVSNAIQALRDFWRAATDLQTALTIGSPGMMTAARVGGVMPVAGVGSDH
ncbi:MAG: TolC family protein [Betaproteobacteria bacterium]|nr:TolC family protein [Betaproteobacteria bacterium]